ncbi:hypothetical protein SynROS8604_02172 [Synechococcus sp. ROS8604]|nr:hypothetical protein SynROS8604_02172 [Synechococcus sp. ROS8604]
MCSGGVLIGSPRCPLTIALFLIPASDQPCQSGPATAWMGGCTYRSLLNEFVERMQPNFRSWKSIPLMLNRWGV